MPVCRTLTILTRHRILLLAMAFAVVLAAVVAPQLRFACLSAAAPHGVDPCQQPAPESHAAVGHAGCHCDAILPLLPLWHLAAMLVATIILAHVQFTVTPLRPADPPPRTTCVFPA